MTTLPFSAPNWAASTRIEITNSWKPLTICMSASERPHAVQIVVETNLVFLFAVEEKRTQELAHEVLH
jgi:hypothetical protein